MKAPKNDYVVTLCEVNGKEVKAIRADGFQNKTDVFYAILDQLPGWNVKGIQRLYEEDFRES